MPATEAQIAANRANAARSTGPRTAEGKAISRRNSLKHGLTGDGVVVPEGDAEEIARRLEALEADMKPMTPAGVILIAQMATLSVRAERAAEQETAAIASRVRNAADAFDEERIERANQLFEALGEDPRNNLRKLRKMPEGVERMIDAWHDLRADLTIDTGPEWTPEHLERAGHLLGYHSRHARGTRLGALSRAYWGDCGGLAEGEAAGLDDEARRRWAIAQLVGRIDVEIAALEAHCETLDFETIDLDRAEAGSRALFDPSRPAAQARRYEAEARRGFFKALKEFRQVEAESATKSESSPAPAPAAESGSIRETPPPSPRQPAAAYPEASTHESSPIRGVESRTSRAEDARKMTG